MSVKVTNFRVFCASASTLSLHLLLFPLPGKDLHPNNFGEWEGGVPVVLSIAIIIKKPMSNLKTLLNAFKYPEKTHVIFSVFKYTF